MRFRTFAFLGLLLALANPAGAGVVYKIDQKITGNANPGIGSQLAVDISQQAASVRFQFTNEGPISSIVTAIAFDGVEDYFKSSPAPLVQNIGTSFSGSTSSYNLPGGNSLRERFESDYVLSAANPKPQNGIQNFTGTGAADSVELWVTLKSGKTYDRLLQAIGQGLIRIGMHAQAIGGPSGGSDAYLNSRSPYVPESTPPLIAQAVPEPSTLLLGGLGAGLTLLARRRPRGARRRD